MSAFCPVCQEYMNLSWDVCPHVAMIIFKDKPIILFPNGIEIDELKQWVIDLDDVLKVLTLIGTVDNGTGLVYFSPSPKVFEQAVIAYLEKGIPVSEAYRNIWFNLGMEHDNWHGG